MIIDIDPIFGTLVAIYALGLRSQSVPDSRVCDFIKLIDGLSAYYYTLRHLPEDDPRSHVNPYPYHYFKFTAPSLEEVWIKRGRTKFRNFSGEIREGPTSFSEIKKEGIDFAEQLLQDRRYMKLFREINRIIEKNQVMGGISWGNIHIESEKKFKRGIELAAEIPKEEVSNEIIKELTRPLDNISWGISSSMTSFIDYIKRKRRKYDVTRLPPQSQNNHLKDFMNEELGGKREKSIYVIVGLCTEICPSESSYYLKVLLDNYREKIELPKNYLKSHYVVGDLENKILRLHVIFMSSQRRGSYLRAIRVEVLAEGKLFDWNRNFFDSKNLNTQNSQKSFIAAT